jgi:hypothetical protein
MVSIDVFAHPEDTQKQITNDELRIGTNTSMVFQFVIRIRQDHSYVWYFRPKTGNPAGQRQMPALLDQTHA